MTQRVIANGSHKTLETYGEEDGIVINHLDRDDEYVFIEWDTFHYFLIALLAVWNDSSYVCGDKNKQPCPDDIGTRQLYE